MSPRIPTEQKSCPRAAPALSLPPPHVHPIQKVAWATESSAGERCLTRLLLRRSHAHHAFQVWSCSMFLPFPRPAAAQWVRNRRQNRFIFACFGRCTLVVNRPWLWEECVCVSGARAPVRDGCGSNVGAVQALDVRTKRASAAVARQRCACLLPPDGPRCGTVIPCSNRAGRRRPDHPCGRGG